MHSWTISNGIITMKLNISPNVGRFISWKHFVYCENFWALFPSSSRSYKYFDISWSFSLRRMSNSVRSWDPNPLFKFRWDLGTYSTESSKVTLAFWREWNKISLDLLMIWINPFSLILLSTNSRYLEVDVFSTTENLCWEIRLRFSLLLLLNATLLSTEVRLTELSRRSAVATLWAVWYDFLVLRQSKSIKTNEKENKAGV